MMHRPTSKTRPHDPYGLTEAPAWPEVDERHLISSAAAFENASRTVGDQLAATRSVLTDAFSGASLWSGSSAQAAGIKLQNRIAELDFLKEKLEAAAKFFSDCAQITSSAKESITNLVELANKILDWVRDAADIPDEAKDHAIKEGIAAIRQANLAIIADASARILGMANQGDASSKAIDRPDNGIQLLHGGGPKSDRQLTIATVHHSLDTGIPDTPYSGGQTDPTGNPPVAATKVEDPTESGDPVATPVPPQPAVPPRDNSETINPAGNSKN